MIFPRQLGVKNSGASCTRASATAAPSLTEVGSNTWVPPRARQFSSYTHYSGEENKGTGYENNGIIQS